MGKRELLLILGFAVAGAIAYQAAAPPPVPGEQSFSLSRIVDHVRRTVQGHRASAEATNVTRHEVPADVTALHVRSRLGALTIVGEDRPDIEAELRARSNGTDAAEARRLAEAVRFVVETAGERMSSQVSYPVEGTQRTLRLTLKVPARLRLVLEESGSPLTVSGVAAVELASRGEAHVRSIRGPVTGRHRGGDLSIVESRGVKIEVNGGDLQVERITGDVSATLRGGDLRAAEVRGAVQVEAQGSDVRVERSASDGGLVRVTAVGGSVTLRDLRTEARLDVRNADVEVAAAGPAPVTIRSEGGGSIDVVPSGGYQLDALTAGGDLTLPDGTVEPVVSGQERRATGTIDGGGPSLFIRSTHGNITIRRP